MDYRAWAERALEFTNRLRSLPGTIDITADLRPPLSTSAVASLNDRLHRPLPEPLVAFLTRASANCLCSYWWEPPSGEIRDGLATYFLGATFIFGGASLCDSERFEEFEKSARDTAEGHAENFPEEASGQIHCRSAIWEMETSLLFTTAGT
jgi:hypothetical protein